MSDLTRYVPTGTLANPAGSGPGRRPSAGAASTADVDFSLEVTHWDALPPQVQALDTGRGDLVAELVVTMRGQARRVGGVLHQERVAARAYRQRLITATLLRPLGLRPDGRVRPVGPWTLHEGTVHRPTSASVWQTEPGKGIRPGPVLTGDPTSAAGGAGVPRGQETGADTALYLPASIRERMAAEVPDPTTWLGRMTQWTTARSGKAVRQEVVVLRMNKTRAVVVAAERGRGRDATRGYSAAEMAGRPWRVRRVRYELDAAAARLAGGGSRRQIGR